MHAIAPSAPSSHAQTLGYVRVSTEQQAGDTKTSLADQARAIAAAAARASRAIDHVFTDAGASGANAEGRPAFMQLVAYCEAHPRPRTAPGLVLALNDSRWGRFADPEEAGYWRVRLSRSGWHVRFAEGDEIGDGIGRMVLRTIGAAQASEYRENIKRNAVRGRRAAVSAGYWCGRAPFGYRRAVVHPPQRARLLENGVPKTADERVKLTPADDEASMVQWAFRAYGRGDLSMRAIARELNTRAPRAGGWAIQTVRSMLANRTYLGEVMTGRYLGNGQHGARRVVRDRSTWLVTEGAHPPLLTAAEFTAVERRLSHGPRYPVRATHLLTGLVSCAVCGGHYAGGGIAGRRGNRRPFYKCARGYDSRHQCPGVGGTVSCDRLDQAVISALADVIASPAVQAAVAKAFDRAVQRRTETPAKAAHELEQRRRYLTQRRDRLIAAIEAGTLTVAEAQDRLTVLRAELDTTAAALERARFVSAGQRPTDVERERLLEAAHDFRGVAAQVGGAALRRLVAPWIERAVFDKRDRTLTLVIRRVPGAGVLPCAPVAGKVDTRKHGVVGRVLQFGPRRITVAVATSTQLRRAVGG